MYTKQEISRQKQAFWTAFGRYMKPVLSTDGEVISWLNYKTGNKHVQFKMDADSRQAQIAVILHHSDPDRQRLYFDGFSRLKDIFEEELQEKDWSWLREVTDEHGKTVSVVQKTLTGVNIFKNEDWSAIISFLKPRIIALDSFWGMVRYHFDVIG
ncbi:DUF4268 domain-containing protein [Flavitalea sp. BT771]|uniref:DUF4268 domain-containing protein n=1 Tax=Flavitalea sp. BT771 TaxID=3063329 RepID=UPI0026E35A7B|nr:DUF4268 domain-containing protein [Flavitalea sp. BT771]MDO6434469.1 DUF4268 domain-containing protein [Flavitalea sp. BT771]MDV6223369.1 DUF4268 domain-containing protein [Flavitalea sp. BT771]